MENSIERGVHREKYRVHTWGVVLGGKDMGRSVGGGGRTGVRVN